jgi:hypothetical protein
MVTVPVFRPRVPWFRSKNLAFACIALMMAYVLRHNERFVIDRSDAFWGHIQTFKWWLLPHGLAGACALLLARCSSPTDCASGSPKCIAS